MTDFWSAAAGNFGSSTYYFRVFRDALRDFEDASVYDYEPPHTHYTRDPYVSVDLPDEYIDAGIVLAKGFTISRAEFEEIDAYDWERLKEWAESMANIRVDELPINPSETVLWIYDTVPCITSLGV